MSTPEPAVPVTLRDLARRLNISHSTASRALRNDPRISAPVRQKVQQLAREMGYRPNPMATGLNLWRSGKDKTVIHSELAWLNHWRDPRELRWFQTFDRYWHGAFAAAEKQGYRLEEFVANDAASLKATAKVLRARNIAGLLIMPGPLQNVPDRAWDEFPWEEFSVVRFGRRVGHPRFHIVTASQTFDCIMAFNRIIERGYQRIGLVSWEQSAGWSGYLGGYLMAQERLKSSQRVRPLLIKESHLLRSRIDHWLEHEQPDAILTDLVNAPEAVARAGYRVPKDIGLAALNVSDIKADAGIFQFPEETGQIAVETLLSLIYHNHRGIPKVPREVLVCGQWQDGRSLPQRR